MSDKVTLTDKFIRSAGLVPKQGRARYWDSQVPGLHLCVTDGGHRSLMLTKRFPLSPNHPTHRLPAEVGAMTLEAVRAKGRKWIELIAKGIDPKVQEARDRAVELRKAANSFAALWQEFEDYHAAKLAKADEARRAGAAFVRLWGARPAADITPDEIASHIRAIAKRTPSEARNRLGHIRRMYSWAIGSGGYGISANPCTVLKPADLVGAKIVRDRILTDVELRVVWTATGGVAHASALGEARRRDAQRPTGGQLGYPYGPLVRLLILTGQRVNEVAGMRWSEIDLNKAMWTIPKERMKGAHAHAVPLASDALALLEGLPRFADGDYVFSTTGGKKSVNGFTKMKERIDVLSGVTGWVLHDLRRTMRTHLSALPVQDMVRELVIAHARPGLHKVYDLHAYADEKRDCLALWEHRLRGILAPKPSAEAADIDAARARRAMA